MLSLFYWKGGSTDGGISAKLYCFVHTIFAETVNCFLKMRSVQLIVAYVNLTCFAELFTG